MKKKRVKVKIGNRRKKWLPNLLIFISVTAIILLVFYIFTLMDFKVRR